MHGKNHQNKYFIYVRKSNEAEDRQIQSIPDQIRDMRALAERQGMQVVDVLQEECSAKAPGRPVFGDMIARINRGEANGIIAWKLNRLARNPIDGGTISWMLQKGVLKHIQTYSQSYYPGDNVIVMAVELGMANQFVRDLSVDTKRGIRGRASAKGYPNGPAPMGFHNDLTKERGNRGWVVDQQLFPLVKQILELYATGRYSIHQVTRFANDELGARTPVRKKQGGKRLGVSYVAGTLLKHTVYAGFFFANDENGNKVRYELNQSVPRMITEEHFWRIQEIRGHRGVPRPSVNKETFVYAGHLKCGTCGGSVTAELKQQLICPSCKHKFAYKNKERCPQCDVAIAKMVNPKYLHYIYYHCFKSKDPNCPEGSIREDNLDECLAKYVLENLEISPELSEWCIRNLKELEKQEEINTADVQEAWESELTKKEKEETGLIEMRMRGLIDDVRFMAIHGPLKAEIGAIQQKIAGSAPKSINDASRPFSLAVGLSKLFRDGAYHEKKEALSEIISNLTLKEKKPSIYFRNEFSILMSGLKVAKEKNSAFEPAKSLADKDKTEVFTSVCPTLLRG